MCKCVCVCEHNAELLKDIISISPLSLFENNQQYVRDDIRYMHNDTCSSKSQQLHTKISIRITISIKKTKQNYCNFLPSDTILHIYIRTTTLINTNQLSRQRPTVNLVPTHTLCVFVIYVTSLGRTQYFEVRK